MKPIVTRILTLVAVAALCLAAQVAPAQTYAEYSAKFVCGVATSSTPMAQPGAYSTTINIHNPHDDLFSTQTSTSFVKKAVQSLPEGVNELPPSGLQQESLPNDFAEEVDCTIIRKLLGITSTTSFIEGYVVIIVPPTQSAAGKYLTNQLDVVGIYTDSKGAMEIQPATEHLIVRGTT